MNGENHKTSQWPFGSTPNAVHGFLRSIDESRTARIVDHGHGQRLYPRSAGGFRHYDAETGVCSEPMHRKAGLGRCVDAWEDDFRFGPHKGGQYLPPLASIVIGMSEGRKVVKARRRDRPNARRDGATADTWKKRAREIAPRRIPELASELIENQRLISARTVGHPPADRYDLAIAAIMRMEQGWGFQEMASRIDDLRDRDVLTSRFHYNRLVEAMGERWLSDVLVDAFRTARAPFRHVCKMILVDGVVLSTAWTDNSRRESLSDKGALQILAHMMYDHRWGVPTAFRLTWYARGLGSGEAPQFPYLLRETARMGVRPGYVLADAAYSSENNFYIANRLGFTLLSPLKVKSTSKGRALHWKPETKTKLGYEEARKIAERCNPDAPSPEFAFLMPFRQVSEAWHAAQKNSLLWYVKSRPDRSQIPPFKWTGKKEQPETHYVGLPKDDDDREACILANQNVGRRVFNEYLCRMIAMTLRATVRAELWYRNNVNYLVDLTFEPVPEDALMGPYRQAA